jgi:hypothetical protein
MDYRKEKNLLIAFDGEMIKARYDWNTNICYGVKGNELKGISPAFRNSTYDRMITSIRWIRSHLSGQVLSLALDRWERLASVGLYTSDHDLLTDDTYDFPNLKKDFVQYLKSQFDGELSRYAQDRFTYASTSEYQMLSQRNRNQIDCMIRNNQWELPIEWTIKALLRLQLEDYEYAFISNNPMYVLETYYSQCQTLGQEIPVIAKNFLIVICKTAHMYQIWKNEHMNENLKQYNDIKELYYENDTYIVRPLITAEQFHEEATAQSNCVERLYMEPVAQGKTHVVVIRRKDAPEKSLVTCEISNDWHIIQYYAKYNYTPNRPEMAFKSELQSYLKSLSQN